MTDLYNSRTINDNTALQAEAELQSRVIYYMAPDRTEFTLKVRQGETLWSLHRRKGQVPVPLLGLYTSVYLAKKAIDEHILGPSNITQAKKVPLNETQEENKEEDEGKKSKKSKKVVL